MALPKTGKLVRDLIPEIILAAGKEPITCVVSGEDYLEALKLKTMEESEELATASSEDILEEVADVLEVLRAIADQMNTSWELVEQLAENKSLNRGGFNRGIWLLDAQ